MSRSSSKQAGTPAKGAYRLSWVILEDRTLPSGLVHPLFAMQPAASAGPVGMTPAQIRQAYGFGLVTFGNIIGDGAGQTIAIVDAYDNPRFVSSSDPNYLSSDLHLFNQAFGLPDPPSFTKINQTGGTTFPVANSGWALEIALDVEWAHALAPQANIVLVEASSNQEEDIYTAVRFAASLPGVSAVSMSFGADEDSGQSVFDSSFLTPADHPGVTFLAASGDNGSPGLYPAYSPNVVAVGGTTLFLNADNSYLSETAWSGSGGGNSSFATAPKHQASVQTSNRRAMPDVAFNANPSSGVTVFDSFNFGIATPWVQVGGTSFSAPAWAAIVAITNQGRALKGDPSLDGATQTLPRLYQLANDFHDITDGGNGGFSAAPGFDRVTGHGTPFVDRVVPDLMILPGLNILPTDHAVTVTELGTSDTFTITLKNPPAAAVTVSFSGTLLLIVPGSLIFDDTNWTVPQTVTVSAIDDFVAMGTHSTIITVAASSFDPGYQDSTLGLVPVTILDNDIPGLSLAATDGSTDVGEESTSDTYQLALTSQPIANVTVSLHTGPELIASSIMYLFTPANWNLPQVVTVFALNDFVAEGMHTSAIGHSSTSPDPNYQDGDLGDLAVTITDDDSPGLTLIPGYAFVTEGTTTRYLVQLQSQPLAAVVVTLQANTFVTVSPSVLTITPASWNTQREIIVTLVDDFIAMDTHAGSIAHAVSSSDANYQSADMGNLVINIVDNDFPGAAYIAGGGVTVVSKSGLADSYAMTLTSQPTANVSVVLDVGTFLTVSPAALTFTPQDWNQPHAAQVVAVADGTTQGFHEVNITCGANSGDANYQGINLGNVRVGIFDVLSSQPGILIVPSASSNFVNEGGAGDSFTVRLLTQPGANVTLPLDPGNQLASSQSRLTFTSDNWSLPQTVTVTTNDDLINQGSRQAIVGTQANSTDAAYQGLSVAIPVHIIDNDHAGLSIVLSGGITKVMESFTDIYNVGLTSQPTADVVVALNQGSQLTVSPATLTFTPLDWNVAQAVTATGLGDAVPEGNHVGTITHSFGSADLHYQALAPIDLRVAISDFSPQLTALTSQTSPLAFSVRSLPTQTFQITDTDTPQAILTLTATSSNQAVVPNGNMILKGTGKTRTLTVRPAPGAVGVTTITLAAFDGNTSALRKFDVRISGNAALPFADSFDQPTLVFLGGTWTNQLGRFTSNGQAVSLFTGRSLATLNGAIAANLSVQAQVNVAVSGQAAGLAVRQSGTKDANLYFGQLVQSGNGVLAQIWRAVAGTKKLLSSNPVTTGSGTLRFEALGSSLTLFLDDQLVASTNDTTLKSGRVGIIGSGGAMLDDFTAHVL